MSIFFIILLLLSIVFCLFIVLTERKLLAHAQRRFGPSIAGRNGWYQIILDLLKLMSKEFFILSRSTSYLLPITISLFYAVQLIFIQNFIFGPSIFMYDSLDGVIFYHLILVMLSNILLVLVGFLSKSKYSILGVVRGIVHVVSLDIFITIIYVIVILLNQSGNFHDFILVQNSYWLLFLLSPISFSFLILLLSEAKRAPFDHIETEAEVVAGYATEHGSIFLLVFYLCEYMHLLISANHFTIFFFGTWSYTIVKQVLNPIFLNFFNNDFYFNIFI